MMEKLAQPGEEEEEVERSCDRKRGVRGSRREMVNE
jgi:hypothetical protein